MSETIIPQIRSARYSEQSNPNPKDITKSSGTVSVTHDLLESQRDPIIGANRKLKIHDIVTHVTRCLQALH